MTGTIPDVPFTTDSGRSLNEVGLGDGGDEADDEEDEIESSPHLEGQDDDIFGSFGENRGVGFQFGESNFILLRRIPHIVAYFFLPRRTPVPSFSSSHCISPSSNHTPSYKGCISYTHFGVVI